MLPRCRSATARLVRGAFRDRGELVEPQDVDGAVAVVREEIAAIARVLNGADVAGKLPAPEFLAVRGVHDLDVAILSAEGNLRAGRMKRGARMPPNAEGRDEAPIRWT